MGTAQHYFCRWFIAVVGPCLDFLVLLVAVIPKLWKRSARAFHINTPGARYLQLCSLLWHVRYLDCC